MRIGCAAITARLLLLGTYAKEELHGIEALNAKESVNELGSHDRVGRVVQRAVMKHLHEATLSLSETRARGEACTRTRARTCSKNICIDW